MHIYLVPPAYRTQPPGAGHHAHPPVHATVQNKLGTPDPPPGPSGTAYPGTFRPRVGNPTPLSSEVIRRPTAPGMLLLGDLSLLMLHGQPHVIHLPSVIIHTYTEKY